MYIIDWFNRLGVESILIPREGTVHAWITSKDVDKIRIGKLNGMIQRLSTSNNRKSLIFNWLVEIINESKLMDKKSVYS